MTLTKGFYLGKYEATQAQYKAVMTGNTIGLNDPSESIWASNRPVEKISWEDAQVVWKEHGNLFVNDAEQTIIHFLVP